MTVDAPSLRTLVAAGFGRAYLAFDTGAVSHGSRRTRRRFRERSADGRIGTIHIDRQGSSWPAVDPGVRLRVSVSARRPGAAPPLNGPCGDQVRDAGGHGEHLRFNARSGSTDDRCLQDLERALVEPGLPWFADARASRPSDAPSTTI